MSSFSDASVFKVFQLSWLMSCKFENVRLSMYDPSWNWKQLGSSSESCLLPRVQVWCLLRLAYLICSFSLEPKFSELVSCLTKNSNTSSQIWKPKCSHLSWTICVPNERLPLKPKINDKRKACTIYLFRQVMPLGWRQSFAQGRATNISLDGWAAQPWRLALLLVLSQAAAQLSACRTSKQMLKHFAEFRSQESWAC